MTYHRHSLPQPHVEPEVDLLRAAATKLGSATRNVGIAGGGRDGPGRIYVYVIDAEDDLVGIPAEVDGFPVETIVRKDNRKIAVVELTSSAGSTAAPKVGAKGDF